MYACYLFHLCLQRHCASVAFQGAQTVKSSCLEVLRSNVFGIPSRVDCWKLDLAASPDAEGCKCNGEDGWYCFPDIADLVFLDADVQCSVGAGCNTFTAKGTVDMVDLAIVEGSEVDVIRAHLSTETTVVTCAFVLQHMKNLVFWSCIKDLKNITCDAECTQEYSPRNVCTHCLCNEICRKQSADPPPKLKRVGNSSKRAEIAAPEHVHSKAADYENADGND